MMMASVPLISKTHWKAPGRKKKRRRNDIFKQISMDQVINKEKLSIQSIRTTWVSWQPPLQSVDFL